MALAMTKDHDDLYRWMMFCFGCTVALMVIMPSPKAMEVSNHDEKTFKRSLGSKISETKDVNTKFEI